jgi:hypothetical protein
MSTVRKFLEDCTKAFDPPVYSIARHVLKWGKEYPPAGGRLPVRRGAARHCFANAAQLVLRDPLRWRYVEGYGYRPGLFPMLHAWVIDPSGVVIDPTWTRPRECEYFGVEVPTELLRKFLWEQSWYGVWDSPRGPQMERMRNWS